MMMGEGCGILVLEMADYVLKGSRSKLWAVVALSEGLKGEAKLENGPVLACCWTGEGKGRCDSCQSTVDLAKKNGSVFFFYGYLVVNLGLKRTVKGYVNTLLASLFFCLFF